MADQPTNPVVNPAEGIASEVEQPISNVPDDLAGKSQQELADIILEQRSMIGRQSNEVGELRNMVSQHITQQESSAKTQDEDVDFYADPERYMERVIDRKLAPFTNVVQQQSATQVKQQLDAEFPQWQETAKSEDFVKWVKRSKVRSQLFLLADQANYDAAAELFGLWRELGQVKDKTQAAERKAVDRDRKLRAVKSEKGIGGLDPRKILYREDLIDLQVNNPDRYQQLLPDIKRAHTEGRVRSRRQG